MRPPSLALIACLVAAAATSPTQASPIDGDLQHAFVAASSQSTKITNEIEVLKHLSAISPYFSPTNPPSLPPTCHVKFSSLLIRHSSILGNDDEWEQIMYPFVRKIRKMQKKHRMGEVAEEWTWLREWRTALNEDDLEKVSEQGEGDAEDYGRYIRKVYKDLLPNATISRHPSDVNDIEMEGMAHVHKGRKGKSHKGKEKNQPFRVWTASSPRDITSAKKFILGCFPSNHGHEGEGDGRAVQLIEVPNGRKEWSGSLTPHKACDNFEKESSLIPAAKWLHVYAPRVRTRLRGVMPKVADELADEDVLAMQMLCGYETIATGDSGFCHVFTDDEWLDFEYYMDVRFHYMMGYGNPLSPYLGMPWVKSAMHLLGGHHEGDWDERKGGQHGVDVQGVKLPSPKAPPNATHTQHLHVFFTHRESPAFVATTLNLYNTTVPSSDSSQPSIPPSSRPPPLTYRPASRTWLTSQIVPFLGHITLERFACTHPEEKEYVRVLVNGKQERMGGCDDGLEGACEYGRFKEFVKHREEVYGKWKDLCEKK